MPAKANSSIVVAMVLRQTINSNPAIPRQILNPARRCCARKEYAVFHMGTYEGAPYLVSELLQGETLRQVLKRVPLSIRKVIDYGAQIAHGLKAAQQTGIE